MIYNLELKGLPFEPHPKQIIYVENTYDKDVNDFIVRNYECICNNFTSQGYEFVYLPLLSSRFNMEVRRYYNPTCTISRNIPIKSSVILDFMAHPENRGNIKPSLLYYEPNIKQSQDEPLTLRAIAINSIISPDCEYEKYLKVIIANKDDGQNKEKQVSYSISRDYQENESYSLSRGEEDSGSSYLDILYNQLSQTHASPPISYAELTFDTEVVQLADEIRERLGRLKQKGISQYALASLLIGPVKPSRMVITPDFRILLPDYNNMEIEMTPLVKAVYFLFLIHPKGIPFKHLADYRHILLNIYCDIRGGCLTDEMAKSVEMVTNPHNNSINEKCARIREAFVKKFDERIAEPYIIQGKRGEPKLISLPRKMVEWQMK